MRTGRMLTRRGLTLLLVMGLLLSLGATAFAAGGTVWLTPADEAEQTQDTAVLLTPDEPEDVQGGVILLEPEQPATPQGEAVLIVPEAEGGAALVELQEQGAEQQISSRPMMTQTAAKVTISFAAGEGSGTMTSVPVDKDKPYTLPACDFTAPEGKAFIGWLVDGKVMAPGADIKPAADTSLSAQWAEKSAASYALSAVCVTTDIADKPGEEPGGTVMLLGADNKEVTNATSGHSITVKVSSNPGYQATKVELLTGGTPKSLENFNNGIASFAMPDKPTAVRVSFAAEKATVRFAAGGGGGTMADVTAHKNKPEDFALPDCAFTPPADKAFKAWQVGTEEKQPGDKITLTGDLTIITAVWKDAPKTYAVTLKVVTKNAAGGVDSEKTSAPGVDTSISAAGGTLRVDKSTAAEGELVKLLEAKPNEGYERESLEASAGTAVAGGFTMPAAPVTVTVTYKPAIVTVHFNTNGVGTPPPLQQVYAGSSVSKPSDPSASGYRFIGWYRDQPCTQPYDFSSAVHADLTLYGAWGPIYTVTKNARGEWVKHSGRQHEIIVKRSVDDAHCINYFQVVYLNGQLLTERTDYTVEAGSTVLKLKPACLDKLKDGDHEIQINFSDGHVTAALKVHPPRKGVPTGDASDTGFWAGALLVSFAAFSLSGTMLLGSRPRRRG